MGVGFAGINIANAAGESQFLDLRLTGRGFDEAGAVLPRLPVRLRITQRLGDRPVDILDQSLELQMEQPFQHRIEVRPGFYVATVEVRDAPPGRAAAGAEGEFFFSMTTRFVDRIGGGFQGGAVVGGYHARHPLAGVSGFSGFCLGSAHTTSIKVLSAPTYGATGARDLSLAILDEHGSALAMAPPR